MLEQFYFFSHPFVFLLSFVSSFQKVSHLWWNISNKNIWIRVNYSRNWYKRIYHSVRSIPLPDIINIQYIDL